MNYSKVYNALIQFRKEHQLYKNDKNYCEAHHIIPQCLNGSNDLSNIVNLTAREHYIAHRLLAKIMLEKYGKHSIEFFKLQKALFLMSRYKKFKQFISSRTYAKLKEDFCISVGKRMSLLNKGKKMSEERKRQNSLDSSKRKWMSNKQLNKSHFVKPEDIQFYLENGYVFGRILDQSGDKNPIHKHIFTDEERQKHRDYMIKLNKSRRKNKQ